MFNLKVDGNIVSTHNTLDDAFKARNEKVIKILEDLYDNDVIDKYGMQDWGDGLDDNKDMEFYIDEGCGYSIDIEKA